VTRIAHEIVERNHGADDVVLVGLYTRGVALARRIATAIASFEAVEPALGTLDVAFYRDDIGLRPVAPIGPAPISHREWPVEPVLRAQSRDSARRDLRVELHFIKEAPRSEVAEEKAKNRSTDQQQDSMHRAAKKILHRPPPP